MSGTLVRYERGDDGVALLTLTAPPANTYSYEMMRQLDAAILDARMDDDVHVLVLRGAGEKLLLRRRRHPMLPRSRRASSTTSACTPTRRCPASSRRPSW